MISNEDRKLIEDAMKEGSAAIQEKLQEDQLSSFGTLVELVSNVLGMPLVDVEFIDPATSEDGGMIIWKGWYVVNPETDERIRMDGRVDYTSKDSIDEIRNALARSVALAIAFRSHPKGQQVQEYMKLCTLYNGDLVSVAIQWLASTFIRKYLEENDGLMPLANNILRKVAGVVNEEGMKFTPLIKGLKLEYDLRKKNGSKPERPAIP